MARYSDAVCRLCRREGMKLFLKGAKCDTPKCPVSRRPYAPGQHGQRRGKASEYRNQLREKQKLKRTFGVLERQFQRYFAEASRTTGNTGLSLLNLFEQRLDNVVYRAGFALSRAHARQLVCHGHFRVNDRKVDIASYQVRKGDVITVSGREKSKKIVKEAADAIQGASVPSWLQVDPDQMRVTVSQSPTREEFSLPLQEQLVVELCSK